MPRSEIKRLMDLGKSLTQQLGCDSADSVYEHTAILGRVALEEFIRRGRDTPHGMFEDCLLRFSPRMLNIFGGKGAPVAVLMVGEISKAPISLICRIIWDVFGLPARVLRTCPIWPETYDPTNKILNAEKVLKELQYSNILRSNGRVIALTDLPLRAVREISKANKCGSVYGYAGLTVPVAVCSFNRLKTLDTEESLARIVKVVVHELAHTFGLEHCQTEFCIMNTQLGRDGRLGLDYMGHEFCVPCLDKITNRVNPNNGNGMEAQQ